MDAINNMTVFVRVVEKESFTAAANVLNCSTSSISKRINQLEHDVGAKLLNRTTHSVLSLTEAGKIYFERARRIIYEIESAKESVLELTQSLNGTLKVHMTPGTGLTIALPAVIEFMKTYPSLTVEVSIKPEVIDILRMGFDVSIRSGAIEEDDINLASIDAHRLSKAQYAIAASPEYLSRRGRPVHPTDLVKHNCLISSRQHSPTRWWFWQEHKKFSVEVSGTLFADNWSVIYDAARSGLGIARLLQIHPAQHKFESLEILFPHLTIPDRVIWALTPHMRPMPKKISVFLDFMRAVFTKEAQAEPVIHA